MKYLFSTQKCPTDPCITHCPPKGVGKVGMEGRIQSVRGSFPKMERGLWGQVPWPELGEERIWGMCLPAGPATLVISG